jgi:hypothetical protein
MKVDLKETGCDGVDWIDLAQDRDKWRAVANTLIDLGIHKMRKIFEEL